MKLHTKKELIQKKRIYWNQKRFQNVNSKTIRERKRNKTKRYVLSYDETKITEPYSFLIFYRSF